jgi:hypothetical protein
MIKKNVTLILFALALLTPTILSAEPAAPAAAAPVPSTPSERPSESKDGLGTNGGIKLRVVAVNPSKDKVQKVPIKIFLPKEVIPDDIVDMGELKVGYDSHKRRVLRVLGWRRIKAARDSRFRSHLGRCLESSGTRYH